LQKREGSYKRSSTKGINNNLRGFGRGRLGDCGKKRAPREGILPSAVTVTRSAVEKGGIIAFRGTASQIERPLYISVIGGRSAGYSDGRGGGRGRRSGMALKT